MDRTEAFTRAIQECIDEGILVDYLKANGSEVLNMLTQEWDMGKALDVRFEEGIEEGIEKGIEKGKAEGREEGREEGIDLGKLETARRMLSRGFPLEEISLCTDLPAEKIKLLQ
jgi:predicted transposase/invertase (TIGR01784 family)